MDTSQVWNGQDPTLSGPDDFQQFLDMNLGDNLQFDFQDFQQQQDAQMMQPGHGDRMDTRMGNVQQVMGHDTTMQEALAPLTTTASYPTKAAHGHPSSSDSLVELDAQIQYLQQQRQQQQQRQIEEQQRNYYARQRMIPPTPNSVEMHGATSQYYGRPETQQVLFDRYQMQVKDQDMAFTPLVSPAVTPLETHFSIPEYTVPGAYFSPLSSPALHAQSEHSSVYDQRLSGTTNSPIDMNVDSHSAPASSVILSKKPSKKPSAPKPRNTRAVRQSPIVKPKRGKRNSFNALSTQVLGDILEPPAMSVDQNNQGSSAPSTAESESDSISPEHLSDMAPPPLPVSANRSPYVQAHKDPTHQRLSLGSPATPASLMRLPQSPQNGTPHVNHNNMDIDEAMDEFALPEPATTATRPKISRIENSDGQTTPTLSSTGVKSSFSMPSPSLVRSGASVSKSPQIDAMSVNGRKTPMIAAKGPKKRPSNSILASPALLPRISPSIKPLLPGSGRVSEDTASLLLASKSNYQNILEGTHLPGVSYPSELSTNLTSKRTSHKIAEQGRRNRINSALQEIATLLPKGGAKDSGCEKSGDAEEEAKAEKGKASSQSANSKASTVELAIEYIKQLQEEVAEANKRAEKAEKELENVKT